MRGPIAQSMKEAARTSSALHGVVRLRLLTAEQPLDLSPKSDIRRGTPHCGEDSSEKEPRKRKRGSLTVSGALLSL